MCISNRSRGPVGEGETEESHRITLYSNGFQVDDGPIRLTDDPANDGANAKFVDALKEGIVPLEMREGKDPRTVFSFNLDDSKMREPAPFSAFSGGGQSMGGSEASGVSLAASASAGPPTVDTSAPTVRVQVRLAGGRKRAKVTLNTTHTAADLYALLAAEHPLASGAAFELLAGFPPKALSDPGQSMTSLDGESITQKEC